MNTSLCGAFLIQTQLREQSLSFTPHSKTQNRAHAGGRMLQVHNTHPQRRANETHPSQFHRAGRKARRNGIMGRPLRAQRVSPCAAVMGGGEKKGRNETRWNRFKRCGSCAAVDGRATWNASRAWYSTNNGWVVAAFARRGAQKATATTGGVPPPLYGR